MKTEKFLIDGNDTETKLKAAAEILKNDGIVAIPTETVYGLAASAYSDVAIKKVFSAKGRPQDNPLIVHIADMEMLGVIAAEIPKEALTLAAKYWPGPLTIVLKKTDRVAESVSAGLSTVAVRMPSHKIAKAIIEYTGLPLAAPSANISGRPSTTSAEHVLNDLDGRVDGIVLADESAVGVESTVVNLSVTPPRLLRPGAVTVEQLMEILPDLVVDKAVLSELQSGEKAASPGMKYKHYSPETEIYLVEGTAEQFKDYVNQKTDAAAIGFAEDTGITIPCFTYGSKEDESTLAHNIFNVLREIDKNKFSAAYVHSPSKTGVGLAVYNRLIRAAAFKVIKL